MPTCRRLLTVALVVNFLRFSQSECAHHKGGAIFRQHVFDNGEVSSLYAVRCADTVSLLRVQSHSHGRVFTGAELFLAQWINASTMLFEAIFKGHVTGESSCSTNASCFHSKGGRATCYSTSRHTACSTTECAPVSGSAFNDVSPSIFFLNLIPGQ